MGATYYVLFLDDLGPIYIVLPVAKCATSLDLSVVLGICEYKRLVQFLVGVVFRSVQDFWSVESFVYLGLIRYPSIFPLSFSALCKSCFARYRLRIRVKTTSPRCFFFNYGHFLSNCTDCLAFLAFVVCYSLGAFRLRFCCTVPGFNHRCLRLRAILYTSTMFYHSKDAFYWYIPYYMFAAVVCLQKTRLA